MYECSLQAIFSGGFRRFLWKILIQLGYLICLLKYQQSDIHSQSTTSEISQIRLLQQTTILSLFKILSYISCYIELALVVCILCA